MEEWEKKIHSNTNVSGVLFEKIPGNTCNARAFPLLTVASCVRSGPHFDFLSVCFELSSLMAPVTPCFLAPRKIGTSDPDNLFLGMTNPDLAANIDSFWPLVVVTDEVPDILWGSGAEVESISALILLSSHVADTRLTWYNFRREDRSQSANNTLFCEQPSVHKELIPFYNLICDRVRWALILLNFSQLDFQLQFCELSYLGACRTRFLHFLTKMSRVAWL